MKFAFTVISALLVALSVDAANSTAACDADKIKASMKACDSLPSVSQVRCADKACHKALHFLVEDSIVACYEQLGLGKKEDLSKYKALDEFCHGDGEDPLESGSHAHHHEHAHAHSGSDDDHDHHDHAGHTHGSSHGANKTTSITSPPAAGGASGAKVPTPAPTSAGSVVTLAPVGVATAIAVAALA